MVKEDHLYVHCFICALLSFLGLTIVSSFIAFCKCTSNSKTTFEPSCVEFRGVKKGVEHLLDRILKRQKFMMVMIMMACHKNQVNYKDSLEKHTYTQ